MEGISKEEAEDLLRQAWYPFVPAMAKIHAEQALEDSKQGFYVREAIFDRLFDKPKIKIDSVEHRQISVVIRPYTQEELDSKTGLTGGVIDGEARVLDLEVPPPAAIPAAPPTDNTPSDFTLNLRVIDPDA